MTASDLRDGPTRCLSAIARHDLRLLKRDPTSVMSILLGPLVFVAFFTHMTGVVLRTESNLDVSGAEHSVPAMSLMFGSLIISSVGFSVFREHGWGTWDRLRVSPAKPWEIILGKAFVPIGLLTFQYVMLMIVGVLTLDLPLTWKLLPSVGVAVLAAMCFVAIGLLIAVSLGSIERVNLLASLVTLVIATIGGTLVPVEALPGWASTISPIVPSYWVIRADRALLVPGGDWTDVALSCGVVAAMIVVTVVITTIRFDASARKVYL
jgi:ABC-2 type transport system permease protein